MTQTTEIVVIGAGPYGLSVAAHLRAAGLEPLVFGRPMDFWSEHMPVGMFLRSSKSASSIADPAREFSLERYEAAAGKQLPNVVPLADFIAYGQWFASQAVPIIDSRRVLLVESDAAGFRLSLDDETALTTARVVIAAGIAPFAVRPPQFEGLPDHLVSHTVEHRNLEPFRGKRTLVIGAGQSALETAALLHEAGSDVEILTRAPAVVWIPDSSKKTRLRRRLDDVLYAPTEVGPPGAGWIAAAPDVFRRMPRPIQRQLSHVSLRPMGSGWLRTRLASTPITSGRVVTSVSSHGERLRLTLDDGSSRQPDHVMLGTGFRIDVARYAFLGAELVHACTNGGGAPLLTDGFESPVPGLYFVGATAVSTFGPVMRFVSGTPFAARALTRQVLGAPPALLSFSH